MVIYSACLHHNALLSLTDISSCMLLIAGILCLRGIYEEITHLNFLDIYRSILMPRIKFYTIKAKAFLFTWRPYYVLLFRLSSCQLCYENSTYSLLVISVMQSLSQLCYKDGAKSIRVIFVMHFLSLLCNENGTNSLWVIYFM